LGLRAKFFCIPRFNPNAWLVKIMLWNSRR
jgi:hypothetical protein